MIRIIHCGQLRIQNAIIGSLSDPQGHHTGSAWLGDRRLKNPVCLHVARARCCYGTKQPYLTSRVSRRCLRRGIPATVSATGSERWPLLRSASPSLGDSSRVGLGKYNQVDGPIVLSVFLRATQKLPVCVPRSSCVRCRGDRPTDGKDVLRLIAQP